MTNSQATGSTLYIVATPIGNLEDISLRAINILKSVDFILAEDTRHSMQLLNALGIKNTLRSFHAHNESEKSDLIIEELLAGKSAALISDAGTPLISDPGYPLVVLARQKNIDVIPIPGACALIAALSAAGIACDSFTFQGFLPAKQPARVAKLQSLSTQTQTVVFYESTHRILDCINDISAIYGPESSMVLAKELTKTYERFISGTVREVQNWLAESSQHIKGEFVLIIPPRTKVADKKPDEELLQVLLEAMPLKQAVTIACKLSTTNKNDLYQMALELKK
ncbi:MAG: 16S rRNA (cytidine(1402)-2'-O)-methyltransferase [Legionella sp.]|jgi:16S rRNA (cytidine1402-2'-O)-methyltransferase